MKTQPSYIQALTTLRHALDHQIHNQSQQNMKPNEDQQVLAQTITKFKTKRIMKIFVGKLRRNLMLSKPQSLQNLKQTKNNNSLEGVRVPKHLFNIVLFLCLIILLITIFLSSFEGFIRKFRTDHVSETQIQTVTGLKIGSIIIFIFKFIGKNINIHFEAGIQKKYLKEISWGYVRSFHFFFDLIMIILLILFLAVSNNVEVSVILFIYCIIMFAASMGDLATLETSYIKNQVFRLYWDLIKIALFNILFAHFVASMLFAMSEIDLENNWLISNQINDEQWYVQYLFTYYWATTIMMTVGFGDYLPHTYEEAIVTAFLQMISCVILAYNISEIGSIIAKIRQSNQEIQIKLGLFERMGDEIERTPENSFLKNRISNYIRQSNYLKSHFEYEAMEELLDELPQHLRMAFIHARHSKIFANVIFFKNLREETLILLAESFQRKLFYPGAYLENEESVQKIQILDTGIVGFGYKKRGSSINGRIYERIQIKKEETPYLLNKTFLKMTPSIEYSLIADSYAIIWSINYQDFLSIISQSKIDLQHYFSILHKHSYSKDEWETIQCHRCGEGQLKQYHLIYECPKLHYMPLKWVIIERNRTKQGVEHNRLSYKRAKNDFTGISALKLRKKVFKQIENFNENIRSQNTDEHYYFDSESVLEEYEKRKREKHRKVGTLDEQNFKQFIIDTLRFYESGYKDDFWDLHLDTLHDYLFYFPNQNPIKLDRTSTSFSPLKQYWKNKSKNRLELLDFSSK